MVMAPVVRGRKGEYGKLLESMRAQGYARAMIDGELKRLDEPIELDKKFKHDVSIVTCDFDSGSQEVVVRVRKEARSLVLKNWSATEDWYQPEVTKRSKLK